jgi:cytidylate kinase
MKSLDRFFTKIPYVALMSVGNRIELPICIPNYIGAEAVFGSDGTRIISCGTEIRINGNPVASAIITPGDIVQIGSQKLRYNVAATGTRKLAVFVSETNDITQTSKLGSWLITQQELRERQQRGEAPIVGQPPAITISRQLGSSGAEIAARLGQELVWNVWDREIIDKIATDANVHREMVALMDERRISAFEEMTRGIFTAADMLTWQTYVKHLIGAIISIGQQGKAIIVGRGANFILPEALNVRIIASFDYRLENLMTRDEIAAREAENRIVQSDQDRANFIKKVFGADIDDVALYDLILRMDEFSSEDAIEIIQTAMRVKFKDSEV